MLETVGQNDIKKLHQHHSWHWPCDWVSRASGFSSTPRCNVLMNPKSVKLQCIGDNARKCQVTESSLFCTKLLQLCYNKKISSGMRLALTPLWRLVYMFPIGKHCNACPGAASHASRSQSAMLEDRRGPRADFVASTLCESAQQFVDKLLQ
jgi:hypothetical protein